MRASSECRSPQGSVDRNWFSALVVTTACRRSPHGSVDRNDLPSSPAFGNLVASLAGAWIETDDEAPRGSPRSRGDGPSPHSGPCSRQKLRHVLASNLPHVAKPPAS